MSEVVDLAGRIASGLAQQIGESAPLLVEESPRLSNFLLLDEPHSLFGLFSVDLIDIFQPIADLPDLGLLVIIDPLSELLPTLVVGLDERVLLIQMLEAKLSLILEALLQVLLRLVGLFQQPIESFL